MPSPERIARRIHATTQTTDESERFEPYGRPAAVWPVEHRGIYSWPWNQTHNVSSWPATAQRLQRSLDARPSRPCCLDALAPRRRLAKLLPRKIGIASIGSAECASPNGRNDLAGAVASRCRRRPLAVLLDEAHTLALDVGSALLNGSQEVRGARAPFLLVLAGTPGLPTHLDAMNASFWSRLGEGELGIGRLSEKAAKQALADPLEAHGVDIDADTLAHVVAQSQCYPYFIQLWGDALWQRHLASGAPAIAREDAEAVQPTVATRVANYHQRRFAELESEGLVPVAAAVARLFVDRDAVAASNQDVDAALAASGIDDASERYAKREALNRLGYVWRPPYQQAPFRWHAGIPSLMTKCAERGCVMDAFAEPLDARARTDR